MSLVMGFGALLEPDGSVAFQEDDWTLNGLHDAGEQTMLNVFLKEQANVSKFLGLLNDSTVAETDGTMAAVTEVVATPPAQGYGRQQILNTEWTDDGLVGGDYRFSAVEKTFGPFTISVTFTHSSLSTTATGAGILLATLALSGTTTANANQSFKYVLRTSAS